VSRWLQSANNMGEDWKLRSSSICIFFCISFLHPSSQAQIFPSDTLSLCSSVMARDQVPHSCKTARRVVGQHFVLTFTFSYAMAMRKYCDREIHRSPGFDRFRRFEPLMNKKNVHFGMLSVQVCMCATLALERLYGFCSYSGFGSLSIVGRRTTNLNVQAQSGGPSDASQKRQFSRKRF
jgi:hypothetical protein